MRLVSIYSQRVVATCLGAMIRTTVVFYDLETFIFFISADYNDDRF